MTFRHLCKLKHKLWEPQNWYTIHSFPSNHSLKYPRWSTCERNPQENQRCYWQTLQLRPKTTLLLTKPMIVLEKWHFSTCAHSTTNTENHTTVTISTHFQRIIAWNTLPAQHTRWIRKRINAVTDETYDSAQNLSFWHFCTLNHKHWDPHKWYTIHSFPTNHSLERFQWSAYKMNPQENQRF
jgi:hypothetical protein